MKKIILFLLTIILVYSCTEDKGTYDYKILNEVVISGVKKEYLTLNETPFSITPQVQQKLNSNESVLEYEWYIYADRQPGIITLATTKDLNLEPLSLAPQEYHLVFKVTDTATGVYYDYESVLDVKGFPDGLVVLSNNDGDAQVSILRGVEEGLSDFEAYKSKNNEIAGTDPVDIIGISPYMSFGDSKPIRIAILCNDETFGTYVSGADFEKTIHISDAFADFTNPTTVKGLVGHMSNYVTGVFGDNMLYTSYQPGPFTDPECHMLFSFSNISLKFKAPSYSGFVFYDSSTTGFGLMGYWGSTYTLFPAGNNENAPFDVTNTGLVPLYGKTSAEYSMGVFIDEETSQKYILALLDKEAAFKNEINGVEIDNATIFEFLNSKQVLFYAYNNKIYTYDVVANRVLYTYELATGVYVDHIKISKDDSKLFVGFSDGSNSGSVNILDIDLDGEILGVKEAYDNKFGRVIGFFENY